MRHEASPADLGLRLREARKTRQLNQGRAAEHIGVARTTLVAMEKGQRKISDEELVALARLYDVPLNRLVGPSEVVEEFVPQLRKPDGAAEDDTALNEAIAEFRALCEDYLTLERLAGVEAPGQDAPHYPVERSDPRLAAQDVAARERGRLGLGDAPVPHLRDILELDAGLRVFSLPVRPSTLAGMYAYTSRLGGCILVNRSHPAARQRWSLAHEYAHHLTRRLQGEVTLLAAYERKPRPEQFADSFAEHFLMPGSGVRSRFRDIVGENGDFKVADLCRLAHLFAVSVQAMCLRLEALRLIPAGTWDRLEGNGLRIAEARRTLGLPEDTGIGPELPARYRALAVGLYVAEQLTEGQLARYLRVDRVEARKIVRSLTRSLVIDDAGNVGTLQFDLAARIGVLRS